jgi:hypothetical protein
MNRNCYFIAITLCLASNILGQPKVSIQSQSVPKGSPVTFTAIITNGNDVMCPAGAVTQIIYSWEKFVPTGSIWEAIGGNNTTSYTIPTTKMSDSGTLFQIQICEYDKYQNNCVCFQSNTAVLSVTNSTGISVPPKDYAFSANWLTCTLNRIEYVLPIGTSVSLQLFDLHGRQIASFHEESQGPGYYNINLNRLSISKGYVIVIFKAGNHIEKKNFLLLK